MKVYSVRSRRSRDAAAAMTPGRGGFVAASDVRGWRGGEDLGEGGRRLVSHGLPVAGINSGINLSASERNSEQDAVPEDA
jgi:hypothetical protein